MRANTVKQSRRFPPWLSLPDDGNADAYAERGRAYCELGLDYEKAIADLNPSLLRLDPDNAEAYENRMAIPGTRKVTTTRQSSTSISSLAVPIPVMPSSTTTVALLG